ADALCSLPCTPYHPDTGIRRSTAVMDRVHPLPAGGRDWKIAQPAISVNIRFSKILVTLGDPRGNFRSRRARAARRARYGELRSRPELRNRARGAAGPRESLLQCSRW